MINRRKKTASIAVVGAGIRLPQTDSLSSFWKHLVNEKDLISEIPPERWDWKKHYDLQGQVNTTQSKWGGFLDRIDRFDAAFFRISNREANLMDPQQRILLELTWEAFEDAGYKVSELSGSRTGVFIGACHNDYSELIDRNLTEIDAYITTGTCPSILANRLSYFFNFHGPSLTVNTACSSSLVAVHQAVQSLQTGESEWAIAGGVNLCLTPKLYIASSRAGMLAKDGRCKTFAEGADGYVRGEGAGVVLLKPLEKAVAQRDHIYAVIRGSAANHGGAVNSITVPNPQAQAELIAETYSRARIRPERVTYIETHGTGTALGDPIEVFGLKKAFQQLSAHFNSRPSKKHYCGLGSVKTNIGHLEPAAGIAGLIKVLLSLQHHKIPATLHLEKVSRLIDIKDSPFYFVTKTKEWAPVLDSKKKPVPRTAGVSSFGFGGANAHVVLEEYEKPGNAILKKSRPELIVLSAKDQEALHAYARRMEAFCAEKLSGSEEKSGIGSPRLRDLAFTLQTGREEMEERLAIIARDLNDLHHKLSDFLAGTYSGPHIYQGNINRSEARIKPSENEAGQAIRKRDLAKTARYWISGYAVPWKRQYSRQPANRIPLPTYSFMRQSHWIPLKPETEATSLTATASPAKRPAPAHDPANVRSDQDKIRLKIPGTGSVAEAMLPEMPRGPEKLPEVEKAEAVPTVSSVLSGQPVERGRADREVKAVIKEKLAQTLYADPSALDENKPFAEIGLDSILAVELVKSLNQEFGIDLKASKLYDHASITLLTEYLAGIIPERKEAVQVRPAGQGEQSMRFATAVPEKEEARPEPAESSIMATTAGEQTGDHENLSRDIAIIGMAGRFPGAENLEEYWQNLAQGRDCVTEIPPERWDIRQHYNPDPTVKNKSYGKWGGFLKNIDLFDPLFFNISPAEAKIMDPHQRLVLEEAWKALEDAGYPASKLNRIKCGLFVGAMSGEEYFPHIYNLRSIMASRLAYFLNLKGPAMNLDTACSSALVAVHLACQSLWEAETELMIAGGISLYLTEKLFVQMSQVKMLSPRGKNRPFDDRADGIVPAEGVGMVVLKRLDKALADHDRIYAVIKGSGINQDGRTNSITAPSLESQKNLEMDVYRRIPIHPETISYVEAHGTGTKLGDPIEIDALTEAFAEFTHKKQYCAIGSVKSNLGHTSAAAGMASLIKVALAMQYGRIPPTIHYKKENQHIRFKETPFYVVTEVRDWNADPGMPRRAAVSAFGISGTNVHLIMEEHRTGRAWAVNPALQRQVMVLSAKNRERLQEYVKQFRSFIGKPEFSITAQKDPAALLTAMAYTLQTGREPLKERLAVLVSDLEELKSALDRYLDGSEGQARVFSAFNGPNPFGNEELPAKENQRQIAGLIFQKQLPKLAWLWVRGYEIDWILLYGKDIPVKMSLPGYALDRKRYWKDESEESQTRLTPIVATETAARQKEMPEEHSPEENPPGRVRTSVSGISGEEIALHIKRELADILCLEQKNLDEHTPLQELGLDSIFSVELMGRLNKAFQTDVKASELYNYPTIRSFSAFFESILAVSKGAAGSSGADLSAGPGRSEDPTRKPLPFVQESLSVIKQKMKQHLAAILSIDGSEFDEQTPFQEFGLDSIFAVELVERLNKDLRLRVKASELYNHPTIGRFAAYLEALPKEDPLPQIVRPKEAEPAEETTATEPSKPIEIKRLILKQPAASMEKAAQTGRTIRLSALEQKGSGPQTNPKPGLTDIAVVGMSGRFPGAPDLRTFWRNLTQGVDSVTSVPADRWGHLFSDEERRRIKGGFLQGIDRFDPLFFKISPMEAEVMDPQQRLFLEEAWKAFEDAGYAAETLDGKKCGIFVGVAHSDYLQHMEINAQNVNAFHLLGTSNSILGARLSYLFNLIGPNMALDTACSSSLVAICEACRSIADGESELALAGGVCVLTTPNLFLMGEKAGMLSGDGICRAFDRGADGFVLGEGVGVVVLKPLAKALEDRNPIYGVIKGWGVNQDGKTNGLTAPNGLSQARLEKEVYEKFGIDPGQITYVEAHGTGTKLGDPIEVNALIDTFGQYTAKKGFCALGSVKTNIGHSLAASGVAGLIKVLLCLKHRRLVPSLHFKNMNPHIRLAGSPFFVSEQTQAWNPDDLLPRQAAVSSFGFSGTNCHIVLEQGPAPRPGLRTDKFASYLIVLSAKTEKALLRKVKDLEQWLGDEGAAAELGDMAFTLLAGRTHFDLRLALVVRDPESLRRTLQTLEAKDIARLLQENRIIRDEFGKDPAGPETLGRRMLQELKTADPLPEAMYLEKLETLAQGYRLGFSLDWQALYAEQGRSLLSMPAYPFLGESYWVTDSGNAAAFAAKPAPALLERVNSDLSLEKEESMVFEKCLSPQNVLLDQHRVQGSPLLPAVAYLEMAWEAIRQIDPDRRYDLTDIHWLQPAVARQGSLDLRLVVRKQDRSLGFEIRSASGGEDTLHAAGLFQENTGPDDGPQPVMALEEIRLRCRKEISPQTLYELLAAYQVHYGLYFRTLDHIRHNSQEVLGHWSLKPDFHSELASYRMHPGVMDGALHTLACFNGQATHPHSARLPFSLKKVRFLRPLPAAGWVHTRQTAPQEYEVMIGDEEGRVCFIWEGLVLRESKEFFEDFFFFPQWVLTDEIKAKPVKENRSNGKETIMTVYAEEGRALAALIRETYADCPVTEILMGSKFQRRSAGAYEIVSRNPEDWSKCFRDAGKLRVVYFLGGLVKKNADGGDLQVLEQCQEKGLLALFRLFKALDAAGLGRELLCVKIITNQSREVIPGEPLLPFSAGLHGLARSIAKEYPYWTIQCWDADLDDQGRLSEPEKSLAVILPGPPEGSREDLAVRRGNAYKQILQPLILPKAAEIPFRPKGVYLILGGAGGLGLVLSQYLAEAFQARLVLVGRNRPDRIKEEQFAKIRAAGGEVLYVPADGSRFEDLRQAVEQAEKQFGRIRGVVHSAIVLKDAALIRMEEAGLKQVLAPKTLACAHLFNLFKNAALDFMLFFSSGQSFSCKAGQSAYAAASAFEDEYARFIGQRVAYPVKVINWGYWGGVGVVADEKHRENLRALGVQSIEPEQGLEAMRRILGHPLSQVMALKAGKEEQTRIGIQMDDRIRLNQNQAPSMLKEFNGEIGRYVPHANPEPWVEQALQALEKLAQHLLLNYFWEANFFHKAGEAGTAEEWRKALSILPEYENLFKSLLKIMASGGYVHWKQGIISVPESLSPAAIQEIIGSIAREKELLVQIFPDLKPQVELLSVCLKNYPDILQGKISHMAVLFPNGNKELVESVYRGNGINDYYAQEIGGVIRAYAEKRVQKSLSNKIRILELGAGTGGTTAAILAALQEFGDRLEYFYSDVSKGFVEHGQAKFGTAFPFTRFRVLDLEKSPAGQGWETGRFDLALASNVIHATRDISRTLGCIKALLKRQGVLLVHEVTRVQSFDTLIFGLTPGWWRAEDQGIRMPGSPLLEPETWKDVLAINGFSKPWTIPVKSTQGDQPAHQSILLAESDGWIVAMAPEETTPEGRQHKPQTDNSKTVQPISVNIRYGLGTAESVDDRKSLRDRVIDYIKNVFGEVLKIKKETLEIDRTFEHYGVDSLVGLNLITAFSKDLGKLPSTLLFENLTIEQLCGYFMRERFKELKKTLTPAAEQHLFSKSSKPQPEDKPRNFLNRPIKSYETEGRKKPDNIQDLFYLTDETLKTRLRHMPLEELQDLLDSLLKQGIH